MSELAPNIVTALRGMGREGVENRLRMIDEKTHEPILTGCAEALGRQVRQLQEKGHDVSAIIKTLGQALEAHIILKNEDEDDETERLIEPPTFCL